MYQIWVFYFCIQTIIRAAELFVAASQMILWNIQLCLLFAKLLSLLPLWLVTKYFLFTLGFVSDGGFP